MKKILFILLLLSSLVKGQTYPINEAFNSIAAWTCTNGSGLQSYGPSFNYLTTNIGVTPYPNNSVIIMTSPVYSFTNCLANLTVTFPINGRIENGFDFMSFQYFYLGVWTTLATQTGVRNNVLYTYTVPNTTTRFRFRLVTDATVNTNGFSVYYYDIDYFNITCSSVLPIELVSFTGNEYSEYNKLFWITATEINNQYFTIERSSDAINFELVKMIDGAGTSTSINKYSINDEQPYQLTYYRLKQTDFNGEFKYSNIISIERQASVKDLKVLRICNLLGQEVNQDYEGVRVIYYNDGSVVKKY